MYKWFIAADEKKYVCLSDFPSDEEIFEKLKNIDIIHQFSKIDAYEFDKDSSHINIFDNKSGEYIMTLEIE